MQQRVSPRKVDRPERRSTTSGEKLPTLTISSASPSTFTVRPQPQSALRSPPFASASFTHHLSHSAQSPAYAAPLPARTIHAPAVPSVTSPRTAAVTSTAVRASVAISQPQLVDNNLDSSDDEDDSDDDDDIFSGGLESTGGLVMGASPSLNPRQLDLYYQTLQKARNSDNKKFGTTTTVPSHAPFLSVNLLEERSLTTPRPPVDSALEREVEALSRRSRGGKEGEVKKNMYIDNVVAIASMAGEQVEEEEEEEEEDDKINGYRQPSYSISGGGGGGDISGGGAILTPLPLQPNTPTTRVPTNLTPTQLALFRRTLAPTSSPSALINAHLHSAGAKTSDLRRIALTQSTRRGLSSSSSSSSSSYSSLPSPHLMTVSSLALDDLALASLRDESGTIDDDDENDNDGGGDKRDGHRISSSSSSSSQLSSEMRYNAMPSSSIRGTPTLGKSAMRAATQSAARTEAAATHASSPSLLDQQKQQKKAGIDSSLDMNNVNVESSSNTATYKISPYTKSVGSGGGGGFESPINNVLRNSHDQSEFASSSSSRQAQEYFPLSSPMRFASSSSSSSFSSKYESSDPPHFPLSSNSFSSARNSNNNSSSENAADLAEKSSFVTSNVSPSPPPPPPSIKNNNNNGNDPDQSLDDFASLLVSPNRMQTANVNLHGSSVETRFQAMLDAKFKQIGGDEDDL